MKRIDGEKVIDELRKSEFITPMGQGFVFTEQAAKIINAAEEIPAEIAPVTITTKERKIEGFFYITTCFWFLACQHRPPSASALFGKKGRWENELL